MSRPSAYGELALTARRAGSQGPIRSMTPTPSSSLSIATWTCIPQVPEWRAISA